MNAGMVRWGGIVVFIGIAVAVISPFVMVAVVGMQGLQTGGVASASAGAKIMTTVMNLVMLAIMVFVFFTTKGYFNALSYRRADIPIYIIIGVQVVSAVLGLFMNSGVGFASLVQTGDMSALGIVVIVLLVTILVFFVALLVFAIFCISFGNIGGGVWKAVGILYLIALLGILIGIVVVGTSVGLGAGAGSVPSGPAAAGAVLIILALLCYAAAIVCHGIGLILGAGRMERMPNMVDAF